MNVTMTASYGEGKEAAFERLQDELRSAEKVPSVIPYSRNRRFFGRESQLAELRAKLFHGQQTTRIAIVGPGGTGKTQFALQLAYVTKEKDKNYWVFWIDASSKESVRQGYENVAQKLRIPGWDDGRTDAELLVLQHLRKEIVQKWLLVFDNADEISPSLIDRLPRSGLGFVVFTTTNDDVANMMEKRNVVTLQQLTPDSAQIMFENHLINPVSTHERQESKLLLQELSYLPLAIAQAAAYIKLTNLSLGEYRLELLKLRAQRNRGPVTTTLLVSLDRIRHSHSHPLAAEYLFLMACVERRDIPADFLGPISASGREDAIQILNDYAIVTRRPAETAFDMHRLVHSALREWLQEQQWLHRWTMTAIDHLQAIFPDSQHANRSKWRRLLPHTKHVLLSDLIDRDNTKRVDLAEMCTTALLMDARCKEAEELLKQVIETQKRVLGEEHPATLRSMVNLAVAYGRQGRLQAAEELGVQVIETNKRVLGEEHPDTLRSMNNLVTNYRVQGRWQAAEELGVQVIETNKRVLGEEHPDTLTSMANLALVLRGLGRLHSAIELLDRSATLSEASLGAGHPDTISRYKWKQELEDEEREKDCDALESGEDRKVRGIEKNV